MVSPLRRVPFGKRPKRNQKVSPLTYGPSLRLGVPSLRHSSGGIASGRLRFDLLSMCSASPNGAARLPPRMNAGTRPPEGAGGSKSKAAGELTLGLMSGEERGCTPLGLCSSVGVSLLAMTACQPTNFLLMPTDQIVGASLLAKAVDHSTSLLADTPLSRASPLPQLTSVRRKIHVHPRPPVGASLLAMAALQPTTILWLTSEMWRGIDHQQSGGLALAHFFFP
ncbi:hypothetical protein ABIA48_004969 [Pseudomonas sp. S30_BP2TU TE3576]